MCPHFVRLERFGQNSGRREICYLRSTPPLFDRGSKLTLEYGQAYCDPLTTGEIVSDELCKVL
jgi:hypothetical protein